MVIPIRPKPQPTQLRTKAYGGPVRAAFCDAVGRVMHQATAKPDEVVACDRDVSFIVLFPPHASHTLTGRIHVATSGRNMKFPRPSQ